MFFGCWMVCQVHVVAIAFCLNAKLIHSRRTHTCLRFMQNTYRLARAQAQTHTAASFGDEKFLILIFTDFWNGANINQFYLVYAPARSRRECELVCTGFSIISNFWQWHLPHPHRCPSRVSRCPVSHCDFHSSFAFIENNQGAMVCNAIRAHRN